MAQTPMYAAMANSPGTELSADITASDTEISVLDASKLPAAPNLFTVGNDETAETILYTGKSGNNLTGCTRGFNGTAAKGWSTGAKVARNFTGYDHDTFITNIEDLDERVTAALAKADAAETPSGAQQKADDAQQAAEEYADGLITTGLFGTTTGSANTYAVTVSPTPTLTAGLRVTVKINVANTGASTLNVNGLGAKTIKKGNGNTLASGNLKAGSIYTLVYDGTSAFILQGEGGEYGTAGATEVLSGYTIGTESGIVPGTLALTGSATAADVAVGKTFYGTDAKTKLTGTATLLMPGDFAVNANNANKQTISLTYELTKETRVAVGGKYRVSFTIYCSDNNYNCYGRIYVNGVPVGIERVAVGTPPRTYTEDITVQSNDLVQIYIHGNAPKEMFISVINTLFTIGLNLGFTNTMS